MTAQVIGAAGPGHDGGSGPLTGVWHDLVGQQEAVAVLRRAVAGDPHSMTHAWLVTGPPGSGRSNAAKAFAAALQCAKGGCGSCTDCRTSLSGAHPDVTLVRTELLSIGVEEVRDLVRKAAMSPTLGRWQVIVVEDADRITDRGADALLKSIEEPPPRTVWILCAPTPDDVIVTIRSRCRQLGLRTPRDDDVVRLLVERDKVDPPMAEYAAKAAQGHIGRARALARNEAARNDRHQVLQVPGRLSSLGACLEIAAQLVDQAEQQASRISGELDTKERTALEDALGFRTKGARPRNVGAALKEMEDQQKARTKRLRRDAVDSSLTELTTWYRDVLAVQCGAVDPGDLHSASGWREEGLEGTRSRVVGLINSDMRDEIGRAARGSTPEQTVHCLDAILECRRALASNVPPLLAVESLLIQLAGLRR